MKSLDLDVSIFFESDLTEEEIKGIANKILLKIRETKNVKGVGYDLNIKETNKTKS